MKAINLSKRGISPAFASPQNGAKGPYWALTHGQKGRGRWQVTMPLGVRDFGAPEGIDQRLSLADIDVDLRPLGRKDPAGNDCFLLTKGYDSGFLVLWHLDPGFRGSASYRVTGNARVIACGHEAQGDAGRMGGAECPVVLVTGPCQLAWVREGRLYGDPSEWLAVFDGQQWAVTPAEAAALEAAAYQ